MRKRKPLLPCCPVWKATPKRCGKNLGKKMSLTSVKLLGMRAKDKALWLLQGKWTEGKARNGKGKGSRDCLSFGNAGINGSID